MPTDSTTPPTPSPPQKKNADTAILFNDHLMPARHEEGCYEKNVFHPFLVCKRTGEGWHRGGEGHTVLQETDTSRGWFQNRRFRQRKVGGGYRRRTALLAVLYIPGYTSKTLSPDKRYSTCPTTNKSSICKPKACKLDIELRRYYCCEKKTIFSLTIVSPCR